MPPDLKPFVHFFFTHPLLMKYRKVASSNLSQLVTHFQIFRRLMKGKFDSYALWPLAKKFRNWKVDWPTTCDFMVSQLQAEMLKCSFWNHLSPLCEMMMLNTVWWSSLILQYHQLPSILTSFHFFCWEELTFFRISTKKLNNYQR